MRHLLCEHPTIQVPRSRCHADDAHIRTLTLLRTLTVNVWAFYNPFLQSCAYFLSVTSSQNPPTLEGEAAPKPTHSWKNTHT